MQQSSRTLTAVALAGLVLAGAAWILIRSASGPRAIASDAPATSRSSAPERPLDARTPDENAVDARDPVSIPPAPEDPGDAPARFVRGLVLDDATGLPLDRFEVLHSPAGVGVAQVDSLLGFENPAPAPSDPFDGTKGLFELDAYDAEALNVAVFADGYERSEAITMTPDAPDDPSRAGMRTIRLRRGSIVDGRVVDSATGLAVEGALVAWLDAQGKARTGTRERFERTDAFGRFHLGSVPLTARRILAGREDLGEGLSDRLALVAGATVPEIVIDLRRPGG